ncbi:MAG: hypothetical protein MI740_13170, partial [Halanaerobiales bacterium]|nr:hypothetical protein [Halanaerobiales bacterium]
MTGYVVAKNQYNNLSPADMDVEDMWYDEWGSVREIYRPVEPTTDEAGFDFYKAPAEIFTYEHYTADPADIYYVDPNQPGNWMKVTKHTTAGWLGVTDLVKKPYFLRYQGYGEDEGYKDISVTDSYGRVQGQRRLDRKGNVVSETEYHYNSIESLNGTKPYRIDEYFDGKHKIVKMTYDTKGNLITRKEYDSTKPQEAKYTEYNWHSVYTLPAGQTSWQVYGDDTTIVKDTVVYGQSDGTVSANADDNIYAVEQNKLLYLVDSDPNNGHYAVNSMTYEPDGRLKTSTDPLGRKQVIEYDQFGYKDKVWAENSASELYLVKRYKYDNMGQQMLEVDNRGIMTFLHRDGHGRIYSKKIYDDIVYLTADFSNLSYSGSGSGDSGTPIDPNDSSYSGSYTSPEYFDIATLKAEYRTGYDNDGRVSCQWFQDYTGQERESYHYTFYNTQGEPIKKYYVEWLGKIVGGFFVGYREYRIDQYGYSYFGNLDMTVKSERSGHYLTKLFYDEFNRETAKVWSSLDDGEDDEIYTTRITKQGYDGRGNVTEQLRYNGSVNGTLLESTVVSDYDVF